MRNNSAVLIFANTVEKEILKKGIPSSEFFDELNEQVLRTVKKSGLTYFLITENEQIGNSFGERFSNAIQQVFDKGYENVISIGNDTPQLTAAHLRQTNELLRDKKIVLGPSLDGGFYLMGIHKSLFRRAQFLKLPWQTASLVKCVERLIHKSGAASYRLEVLQDIDDAKDLNSLLHIFSGISSEIRRIIVQLLRKSFSFFQKKQKIERSTYQYSFYNKGSPVILHN
ncbi:TIGR04282 family arsenosugar biosynthesis glycosyltransferase [Christiangramia forsetii]|uniref:DUF2064 domain-containing protein n=2 Tax=Christiangramia forsetii TaxID=411153 RepID=A0M7E6_CHRFK|nr:DUF2064 domain-containing protein [Christiangramia forsetii]GGG28084.1 hypothetical protein GCM10011532_09330 [Christiangramia forsetii]CAL68541.1 conserved hypothetical protein [Christiangramia forsetii KT0803]